MKISLRERAARNLLISAINTALERGLIGLEAKPRELPEKGLTYDFEVLGLPALGYVNDIGWEEVSVHVTVAPTAQGRRLIMAWPPHRSDGIATAQGWLERKQGKWLQRIPIFYCSRGFKSELAAMKIAPQGYAEYGRVM